VSALASTGAARAQTATADASPEASSGGLEEVVITARRKTERLQDVPISVSAFSSDQLETLGIVDQATLSDFTPGMEFTDFTNGRSDRGAYRNLIFRGINEAALNTAVTADALVFLDGAPVTFNDILITDSIERVEVLKGPQNVYFGRSTFTGAINYVTKDPGNTWKANTTFEIGNYNDTKFDGHIEGPIVLDKLTFALDVQVANKDGDYTDYAAPSVSFGGRKTDAFSATLFFTPTDDLTVKLYETYFHYDDGISAAIVIPSAAIVNCNPGGTGGEGNFYPCGTLPKLKNAWVAQSINYTGLENQLLNNPGEGYDPMYTKCDHLGLCADTEGTHMITTYKLPWYGIKFNNITAYHIKTDADLANAVDQNVNAHPNTGYFGNPAYPDAPAYNPTFDYNILDKIWDFDTEFRLTSDDTQPLWGTFGANYVRTKDTTQLWFYESPVGTIPPNTEATPGSEGARTIGIFGGVYYHPISDVTLSAEVRRQADKRQDQATTGAFLEETYRSWAPRFSAAYKITPDTNVYASFAKGVKPGGFNTTFFGLPQNLKNQITAEIGTAPVAYQEEKLTTTEVGVKGTFFDHKVAVNVAPYFGKLSNQVVDQTAILLTPDPVYGGRFDLYKNTGTVDIAGIEGDWHWRAAEILTLSGTFAYNRTSEHETGCYSCFLITGSENLNGTRLDDSPEYTATVAADLKDRLTDSIDWFGHIDYVYRGSIFVDQNGLNLTSTGATNKVDMQYGIDAKTYVVTAWVTNLTNDLTFTGGEGFAADFLTGSPYGVRVGLADKRAFGLRVRYNFF